MRLHALCGETDDRKGWMRLGVGMVGAHAMFAICGRRQWNHCNMSESGLVLMVNRSPSD